MQGDLAAINVKNGGQIAERIAIARGMFERMRGLLGRPSLRPGEGLLLQPCNGVHTVGMRYPIDIIFLDRHGRVKRAVHALNPGRMVPYVRGAVKAIELPAGTLARTGVRAGDEVWLVSSTALRL
jgi:uncharacterized membrane protein (UPF0127 family)